MQRRSLAIPAALLMLAVALGAFGAHGLSAHLGETDLGRWRTGVEYQFYHALGMLLVQLLHGRLHERAIRTISGLFLVGVLAFSGSLYLLSTRDITGWSGLGPVLGPITPIGGLCFMAGWGLLLITALRQPADR